MTYYSDIEKIPNMGHGRQVIIDAIDEVYFKVICKSHLHSAIRTHFSYLFPAYRFHGAYKSGRWDGKVSLYDPKEHLLPIGLYSRLVDYCKDKELELCLLFDPKYILPTKINKEEIESFYPTIFNETYKPRDYQHNAICKALEFKRGILELATGAGKSLVLYAIIRLLQTKLKEGNAILLIVPTVMLVDQMYDDFVDYGYEGIENDVDKLHGKISNNRTRFEKSVLISTWQSLKSKDISFYDRYEAVFVDETHLSSAKILQDILSKCSNAEYRIGVTGTLPTEKLSKMSIFAMLGDKIAEKKASELMDEGTLAKLSIINVIMGYPQSIRNNIREYTFQSEEKLIENYRERNETVNYIVRNLNKDSNVLILVRKIEHIKNMENILKREFGLTRAIHVIHGQTKTDRNGIRKDIDKTKGNILIATYGTMSTGVSIKNITDVILASSYKSRIKIIQSIGRGLRKSVTKSSVRVWDMVDDICLSKGQGKSVYMNAVYKHWLERLKYYKEEKYPYKSMSYELKDPN